MLMLGSLTRGHDWGGDFSAYIMQADSLHEGSIGAFMEANRQAVEESSRRMFPVAYPWGFPLLLAPVFAVAGLNPIVLKSVCVAAYLLFLAILVPVFRHAHSTPWLLCLIGLFAFNPLLLRYADLILSDLPFLAVSTLCLLQIRRITVPGTSRTSAVRDAVITGALIAAAYTIRTNGLLLLVALGLSQIIARMQCRCSAAPDRAGTQAAAPGTAIPAAGAHAELPLLRPLIPHLAAVALIAMYHAAFQIGRASCRERV